MTATRNCSPSHRTLVSLQPLWMQASGTFLVIQASSATTLASPQRPVPQLHIQFGATPPEFLDSWLAAHCKPPRLRLDHVVCLPVLEAQGRGTTNLRRIWVSSNPSDSSSKFEVS